MDGNVRYAVQIGAVDEEGATDSRMYDEAIVDARYAQELGYGSVWMVEHHFSDYYPTPNPLMFLSHLAAACPGLGLGTAVMVLPWYDPVRFAEDVAMLRTLTKGRLDIGMGRGTAKLEYDAMRVPMGEARERFRECWEVTRLALKGEPFTYKGQFVDIDQPITLRPHIEPDAEINFFGAIGSPASAEIMADLGLTPLSLAQFPDYMLVKILDKWRTRARQNGLETNVALPISAKCFIGDTVEEARTEARDHLARFYRLQAEHYTTDTTSRAMSSSRRSSPICGLWAIPLRTIRSSTAALSAHLRRWPIRSTRYAPSGSTTSSSRTPRTACPARRATV